MTLEQWRRKQGYTFEKLGEKYGVGPALAWRHCQPMGSPNAKLPSPATMRRIVLMTGRRVMPNDFYRWDEDDAA